MAALRADGLRNRAKVLAAAHAIFAEKGGATTTEEVAKKAGLGIGTVFRHFPTKASLFEALVEERFSELATFAETVRDDETASGEGLFRLLTRMVEEGPAKRAMFEALAATGVDVREHLAASSAKQRCKAAMDALFTAGKRAGTVRKDVSLADVYAVLAGASAAVDHAGADEKAAKRALALVLDGLRKR